MTAITLQNSLSQELTDLIARIGMVEVLDVGMSPEEVRDLRLWLQAARTKHHAELREARTGAMVDGLRQGAQIVNICDRLLRGETGLPCDSEPKGAA